MLRRAGHSLKPHLRRLHQQATTSARTSPRAYVAAGVALASSFTVGSLLWHAKSRTVYNDSDVSAVSVKPQTKSMTSEGLELWTDPDALHTFVWGSNNQQVLGATSTDSSPEARNIRYPMIARWLDNVALRNLQLHKTHAACVDGSGDVYQWGDGFFGPGLEGGSKPVPTLKGKNIVKLQLTEHKVYALSASGRVYVFSAKALDQEPPSRNNSWWGTGWLWGGAQNIRHSELTPKEELGWNEKFVSVSAGENHLLVLTNKGRTFAHPVNLQANHFGQLGFRSFEIPNPAAAITGAKPDTLKVELLPKTVQDMSEKSRRSVSVAPSSGVTKDLSNINDSATHWCTHLYEIPALRGVEICQVAAGGRSSFVRTPTGRVLGWGANEFGQIGLGANVTLDAITVPTEVVLWRMAQANTQSKCLNVVAGGDLSSFIVERSKEGAPATTDLLMCGNGQSGGLGNNTYTNSQGNPVRVKNLSGLLQYNDRTQKLESITLAEIVISPTGHVLVALDSSAESQGVGGQDLMVWGKNYDYELGNGKKSSLAMPVTLDASNAERLMLMRKKAKEVFDFRGLLWKRNVYVEQRAVAGYGNSAVYWKIVG